MVSGSTRLLPISSFLMLIGVCPDRQSKLHMGTSAWENRGDYQNYKEWEKHGGMSAWKNHPDKLSGEEKVYLTNIEGFLNPN